MHFSLSLNSSIADIPGIGSIYLQKLQSLGMNSVQDLLYYFPFRYEDLSEQKSIIDIIPSETITITAVIWSIAKIRSKTGKVLIKAVVNDSTGSLDVVWFNQAYLLSVLKPKMQVNLSGKVEFFGNKLSLLSPKYELVRESQTAIHTARLVPIYSESKGVSARFLRAKIFQLLNSSLSVNEFLPKHIVESEKLSERREALRQIHFPASIEEAEQARTRFAFEELFLVSLRNLTFSKAEKTKTAPNIKSTNTDVTKFEGQLPFSLTNSQKEAIAEIGQDLAQKTPMNRLLQGEVGSGKTVVSAFAILLAIKNTFQAAFMAPTEVLAFQHYETLNKIFGSEIKIALATSSKKINTDNFDLIVGTQALLSERINFKKLALIIVDEQQRFGVSQRQTLREKTSSAHFLTMTATPIPRTLALTLYGKLDISTLAELPSGRSKVKTYFVPNPKREASYEFIRKEVKAGGQVFILCPLISESESLQSVKNAEAEFDSLKNQIFPELNVGLLHGKLSSKDKQKVMDQFRAGQISILVTTAVVEVGIDIPAATIMVIEAAERFGLASLHQLRGRVGRGSRQSYCFLFSGQNSPRITERLKLLEKYSSGFELAEMDLKMRGPGDIFGVAQSGQLALKTASFLNFDIIVSAQSQAQKLTETEISEDLKSELDLVLEKNVGTSAD